ncbi:integrator complex subunit 12 [Musca vetustissima]|uniref:integrator complex subunit 12 n=1 Tax=Musca vetustissima TaxID=27455 RepID=UPI002AB65162|nr:integrator complex subunit 12 [Musca vetustissima]
MSSTTEIETLLKKAVTLLQSSHGSSAAELRLLLDEEIKKRYGADKTLTNNMSKKQLEDEANFPGRAVTPPPQPVEAEEVINLVNSPAKTISDSPDTIADSDDAVSGVGAGGGGMLSTTAEDEANLKEFGDLNCCVCGEMMFTATNRLIECSRCGALYHQECHKPPITDEEASEDQGHNWVCDNCATKPTSSKTSSQVVVIPDEPMPLIATSVASIKSKSSATSSRSSSSSNSSSPFYKMEQATATATGKSSSKSHSKEERSSAVPSNCKVSSSSLNAPSSSSSSSSSKKHSSSSSSSSSKNKSSSSKHHHESKRKSSK